MGNIADTVFSIGPVAVIYRETETGYVIQSVTPNIQHILGYSAAGLVSQRQQYTDLIHPDDRKRYEAFVTGLLPRQARHAGRLAYRLLTGDGAVIRVEEHAMILKEGDNAPLLLGYFIDVTEQHQAEQRHCTNKERLQAITDLMTDWAWEVDGNGVYTYCSDRVEQFLGYRAEEIIGKTPFDLMPEEEAKKIGAAFAGIVERRAPIQNLENWNLSKQGKPVCLLTNGIPLFNEQGELTGYRGVDKDITRAKEDAATLQRAHDAAIEALRVKTEFLANISHELRTPLNGIYGALQVLADTRLDERQLGFLQIAENATTHLIELINNLLSYSTIASNRIKTSLQEVAIRDLLTRHYQSCAMLLRNDAVTLQLHIDDNVPERFCTDPVWITQVMSNLTNNAIKFTPAGTIAMQVSYSASEDRLRIEVKDTGIGIAPDKRQQVFEPFYQASSSTTRRFNGAGLGLAICKLVVECLGGQIALDSQEGAGTSVWFTLPAPAAPAN